MMTLTKKEKLNIIANKYFGFFLDCLTVGLLSDEIADRYYRTRDFILLRKLREIPASDYSLSYTKVFSLSKNQKVLLTDEYFIVLNNQYKAVSIYSKDRYQTILKFSFWKKKKESEHHLKTYEHLIFIWNKRNEEKHSNKNTSWIT